MTEPFQNECCADMVQTKEWRKGHEQEHEGISRTLKDVRDDLKAINKALMGRLPVWATLLLGVLMAALGWFAKG
jgi:hypothetical protein